MPLGCGTKGILFLPGLFSFDGVQDMLPPNIALWPMEYLKLKETENGIWRRDFMNFL